PEQARGDSKEIGPAADLYSLGAILYELLTGRPPFRAEAYLETLRQVQADEVLPPRRLQPKVPCDLETICLKCLEKDPAQRYASAEVLAEELRRFLEGRPIQARRPPAWERGWKWIRRRPLTAALFLVLGLAIMATGRAVVALVDRSRLQQAQQELERLLPFHRVLLAQQALADHNPLRADQLLEECPPAHRNWEWHYLKRQCQVHVGTLQGHTAPVQSVAYSPCGRWIASAGGDKTIRIWEAATRREIRTLGEQTAPILSVAFRPCGNHLASAGSDARVTIWDLATGRKIHALTGHTSAVFSVAYRLDGQRLVSSSRDKTVRMWDVATGREVQTFRGHQAPVRGVAY